MTETTRLIRLPKVQDMVGLGKTAIYSMIKEKKFPAPIKLGRVSVWDEQAVQGWAKGHIAANDALGSRAA